MENLVGGRTFVGEGNSQTPQNAVVIGNRSAKSVNVIDILTQTRNRSYSYTMIVEEGESYTTYARPSILRTETIIVQANGKPDDELPGYATACRCPGCI